MSAQYLYLLEFAVNNYEVWLHPENVRNAKELPTCIRFTLKPSICMEVSDEDVLHDDCGRQHIKHVMFGMSSEQMKEEISGEIEACLKECSIATKSLGSYKLNQMQHKFANLLEEHEKINKSSPVTYGQSPEPKATFDIIKELVQLTNADGKPSGMMEFTLKITCFGTSMCQKLCEIDCEPETEDEVAECLHDSPKAPNPSMATLVEDCCPKPPTCHQQQTKKKLDYDEYSAQINGNSLTLRLMKDSKYQVTRIHDFGDEKKVISASGKQQKLDIKPSCHCQRKEVKFSQLQQQTNCDGVTFRNNREIPAVRGNLKYPGHFECDSYQVQVDGSRKSNVKHESTSRGVCVQVDEENMKRVMEGKCPHPRGIEVCRKGCVDADTDVFVLKIGRKRSMKDRQSEIELEMKTPKGANVEIKRKETRGIQVLESDLAECGKPIAAAPAVVTAKPKAKKGKGKAKAKKGKAGKTKKK